MQLLLPNKNSCSYHHVDYTTANGPDLTTPLTEDEKEALYAELASGAETGWDYTVRFFKQPFAGGTNNTNPGLRTLNVRGTIPICLNSILCESVHVSEAGRVILMLAFSQDA